ncbi:hypothetical protein FHS18_003649 [Paenibacillus phyllosphaerae]|uniref:Uncharacterized protein n=1 Tax=Paenibacillus phyllosphaerae TaxID=274593 RepID=A0A7W5FNQ1_9BACL|nr:hypothetical protein [Paenibacillus phyllosphaerae]MBB3111581.1 hypothetical protein [Paenibacillus phyllosphaerae]
MLGTIFLWSGLVIPWLSLFFLDGHVIRRYLPAAFAITVFNTVISQVAYHY